MVESRLKKRDVDNVLYVAVISARYVKHMYNTPYRYERIYRFVISSCCIKEAFEKVITEMNRLKTSSDVMNKWVKEDIKRVFLPDGTSMNEVVGDLVREGFIYL